MVTTKVKHSKLPTEIGSKQKRSHTTLIRYLHGPGIDEPLAMKKNRRIYYYHADGLGSITALTNRWAIVLERYMYSSFGEVKRSGLPVYNRYTFTGREWDKEIGLYYYRARYYNPEVGRFVTPDPSHFIQPRGTSIPYLLPFLLTTPQELNGYSYAKNNPILLIDPWGLCADTNRHLYEAGNWTGNTVISANLGQAVWITVENVNVLGTTISIRENNSQDVQQSIILPKTKVEFKFTQFGTEPMFRKFNVRTNSDAFIVNYTIESTWVPGMPPNR